MSFRQTEKSLPVALITGVSGGLGGAMAVRFRAAGYRVIGVGRHRPEDWSEGDFIVADLSCPESIAELTEAWRARTGGRLDLLINNAGFGAYATWEELPEAELRRLMEVDFFAPVALVRACTAALAAARGGIINISSVAGLAAVPCMGAYSAAKFALTAFSETLEAELRGRGVRVLTVYPGRIRTGFSSRAVALRQHPSTPGDCVDPARFADAVYRAYRRKKHALLYPGWYGWFIGFTRLFPQSYRRACVRVWKLNERGSR